MEAGAVMERAGGQAGSAQERAAEVRPIVVEALQDSWNDFVADTGCFPDCFTWRGANGVLFADFDRGNFAAGVAERLLADLAAAGLLVDDDTARLVERGRQAEAIEARAREALNKITDEDLRATEEAMRSERRWMRLGEAVEQMERRDERSSVIGHGMWNACLDAIYREAGITPVDGR